MLEAQIETQGINCLMLMYVINPTTNANKCNNIESVILKQPILICRIIKSYNSISASYFCISFAAVTNEERPTIGSKEWLRELPISDEQDKYYVGVILYYITTTKGKLYDRA